MKQRVLFTQFLVLMLSTFSFFAVSAQTTELTLEQTAVTVIDDLDREVTINQPVRSVVSLAPSNTEILCAISLCENLLGVDMYSDYPEVVEELDKVTNFDASINFELILTLAPDLVLVSELTPLDQVDSLVELGLPVYYLANPKSLDDLPDHIMKAGEATGLVDEAAAVAEALEERIAAVDEKLSGITERPLVFYELDATDPLRPWTAGSGTFINDLIYRAGGENIAADLVGAYPQISQEALIIEDPEIIVLGDSNYGVTAEIVAARPGWESLRAVRDGKVIEFDDDLGARPGPRLVDGLEQLAEIFHPELFK